MFPNSKAFLSPFVEGTVMDQTLARWYAILPIQPHFNSRMQPFPPFLSHPLSFSTPSPFPALSSLPLEVGPLKSSYGV